MLDEAVDVACRLVRFVRRLVQIEFVLANRMLGRLIHGRTAEDNDPLDAVQASGLEQIGMDQDVRHDAGGGPCAHVLDARRVGRTDEQVLHPLHFADADGGVGEVRLDKEFGQKARRPNMVARLDLGPQVVQPLHEIGPDQPRTARDQYFSAIHGVYFSNEWSVAACGLAIAWYWRALSRKRALTLCSALASL